VITWPLHIKEGQTARGLSLRVIPGDYSVLDQWSATSCGAVGLIRWNWV